MSNQVSAQNLIIQCHSLSYNYYTIAAIFSQHVCAVIFSQHICPHTAIVMCSSLSLPQVKDMKSMQYLMRYNDYRNDPYSLGNPMNSICSRGDLLKPPMAGGCYDTKVQ